MASCSSESSRHATYDPSPILTIIYATETGNAQDYAGRVAHHCRRAHFKCRVFDVDKYTLSELVSETVIIYIVSTSGTGKEPRTMTPMWRSLLRSDLPDDFFEDLHYAVFGLGDSSYENFCWPAKKLSRRLERLGATAICPRAEGDTQHTLGTDGAFDPWLSTLTDGLLRLFPLPTHLSPLPAEELPTPRVTLLPATSEELQSTPDPLAGDDDRYHAFELVKNERITADDWYQDVRHFEFQCQDDLAYDPGDVAVIHPEASPIDVDTFLTTLGWSNVADDPIRIQHVFEDQSLPDHLPQVSTLRSLFTRHLDINAVPKRSFFKVFKHFTTDEREREKLEEFSSPEGAEELYEYTTRVRRTILEVLSEFRSARVPREHIFELFPPLRPREFSIASASLAHAHEVHLCVAIVNYKTKLKARRRGVCTYYLASLPIGVQLRIGITKGLLTLLQDSTPVICIGPGTGVAPARAVVEARVHLGMKDNTLYFGHRASGKDEHFAREWISLAESGRLTYRVTASRDGPEGTPRVYVQDLIRQDAKRIWQLVHDKGAWVYISGSSNKMPAGVRASLVDIARAEGGMGEEEARAYVARLEREERLFEECWS